MSVTKVQRAVDAVKDVRIRSLEKQVALLTEELDACEAKITGLKIECERLRQLNRSSMQGCHLDQPWAEYR